MKPIKDIANKFIKDTKKASPLVIAASLFYAVNSAEALSYNAFIDNTDNQMVADFTNNDTGYRYTGINDADLGLLGLAQQIKQYNPSMLVSDILGNMTLGIQGEVSAGYTGTIDSETGLINISQDGMFSETWYATGDNPYQDRLRAIININTLAYDNGDKVDWQKGSTIANGIDARLTDGGHVYDDSNSWVAINTPISIFSLELQNSITNTIDISVTTEDYYVSDIGRTFQIAICTNLVDASWTTNTTIHTITNEFTSVSITNNSDTCFFKLVETK
jgi:hypothetical protein